MEERGEKISHEQFYDLITGREVSWQNILNDLIKTEQLDPWDIDIGILVDRYLEVVRALEEANFFISSKVLHACSLLLRLKSEILNNDYIRQLDEELYGKKEDKKYLLERIEIDEDELPLLVPRTPIPRFKKITLKELMSALNKAIETETRRIRRDIGSRDAKKKIVSVMPRTGRVPLNDRIAEMFSKIKQYLCESPKNETTFERLAPTKDEKIVSFLPLLHLDKHEKIYIKQMVPFEDIFIKMEQHVCEEELEREDLEDDDFEKEEE